MDVTVKANVKHDGKWYAPGEEIKKIKAEDGKRLLDLGVAEEVVAKKAPAKEDSPEKDESKKSDKEDASKKESAKKDEGK